MFLETERLIIRSLKAEDIPALQDYYIRNRDFLQPWEPLRNESYYSRESLANMVKAEEIEEIRRKAFRGYLFLKETSQKIIGFTGLTNIQSAYDQSARVGYKLDKQYINKGYITEALVSLISFGFQTESLHRLEAHVMPKNLASQRVMEKLHFKKEGVSLHFRKINGAWEDHILYALINSGVEI